MCTCRCSCGATAAQNAGRGGGGRERGNPPPPGNHGNNIAQGNSGTSGPGQQAAAEKAETRLRSPDRCTQTVSFAGDSAGGGVGATRIVSHLLASKRKSGRAKLHHLFRATNGEFAGQCPENRCLSARAAAARTRDSLVEEAEVAQRSDELEAVASKLAQHCPAK